MKIYVGNIHRETAESEVRTLFEEYGKVDNVTLIRDNHSNLLKGFGFIEMPDDSEGEKAIKNLDGQLFKGRPLSVNIARKKFEDSPKRKPNRPRYR